MPAINPQLVPTVAPGSLFQALTTTGSLNIRWLTAVDPVFFEVFNRPLADIALRQLILAKAVDQLNTSLGHEAFFPYLIQPRVIAGSDGVDVPIGWVWDMSASLPAKWRRLRLAKIKRMAGTNPPPASTDGSEGGAYTGWLRLVFTAQEEFTNVETAIFMVDYRIDASTTYQTLPLSPVTTGEEPVILPAGSAGSVSGFIVFRTLDTTQALVQAFLDTLVPPTGTAANDLTTYGFYRQPTIYELVDAAPGDMSGDYDNVIVSHGTGMLTSSAWAPIPPLDADIQTWITATNYPFALDANLISTNGLAVPRGLFREFDLCVPAGDMPNGDASGLNYPVFLSRVESVTPTLIRLYFATLNITDAAPSLVPIEFALLELSSSGFPGEVIAMTPQSNLNLQTGLLNGQHFGRGHVVLSSLWGPGAADVPNFFAAINAQPGVPVEILFSYPNTRLSSFGLSRVPKYVPTVGQSHALAGTTSRRQVPVQPSINNQYVTEHDQGAGDQVDLEAQPGITPNPAISRYGQTGALCHRLVSLVINHTLLPEGDSAGGGDNFYLTNVLPRLRLLFGRDPVFGDEWFDGTRFMRFNGSTWQG